MISFDNFSLSHEIDAWLSKKRPVYGHEIFFGWNNLWWGKGNDTEISAPPVKILCVASDAYISMGTQKRRCRIIMGCKREANILSHILSVTRREYGEPATAEEITVNGIGHCLLILTLTERRHISATFAINNFVCDTKSKFLKSVMFELIGY